jgi:peroxiredoxin
MRAIKLALAIAIFASATLFAGETARVGEESPSFSLKDYKGTTHNLSDYEGKYVVLEWINYDCPFVKKHYETDNMQSLQREFTKKGVIWLSICSSAEGKYGYFSSEEIEKRRNAWKTAETAVLIDASGSVGKMYNAKTTPDMVVISPDQEVIYMGAIDNIASADQADVKKAENYVSQALKAAMSGKEVEVKSSKPYGCSIKYANE